MKNNIKISVSPDIDLSQIKKLFLSAGWDDKVEDEDRLKLMIENSNIIVTAWDNEKIVGFARCTTDYVFNGQIINLVVGPEYRGCGIGKRLIHSTLTLKLHKKSAKMLKRHINSALRYGRTHLLESIICGIENFSFSWHFFTLRESREH